MVFTTFFRRTLYVADEGDGTLADAATGTGGLQKWILVGKTWQLAYTLTAGLNLGHPYTVPGYPTGLNVVGISPAKTIVMASANYRF